jgi:hypothetical protein
VCVLEHLSNCSSTAAGRVRMRDCSRDIHVQAKSIVHEDARYIVLWMGRATERGMI